MPIRAKIFKEFPESNKAIIPPIIAKGRGIIINKGTSVDSYRLARTLKVKTRENIIDKSTLLNISSITVNSIFLHFAGLSLLFFSSLKFLV
jgi:hypothetical protein